MQQQQQLIQNQEEQKEQTLQTVENKAFLSFPPLQEKYTQWSTFLSENLIPYDLNKALFSAGFENPNLIQSTILPPLLSQPNKSALFQAKSGSGKSLISHIFGITRLYQSKFDADDRTTKVIAIYLSPLLAWQQYKSVDTLIKFLPDDYIRSTLFIAKDLQSSQDISDLNQQTTESSELDNELLRCQNQTNRQLIVNFKQSEIVLGTLGKITQVLNLAKDAGYEFKIKVLLIDEADGIFNDRKFNNKNQNQTQTNQKSIIEQLSAICQCLPTDAQILMYSATFNEYNKSEIVNSSLLHDPNQPDNLPYLLCQGEEAFVKPNISHVAIYLGKSLDKETDFAVKYLALTNVLEKIHNKGHLSIVFVSSIESIEKIYSMLEAQGLVKDYQIAVAYKNKGATANKNALEGLKTGKNKIVIATDGIAGRGIDIPSLQSVIQFDISKDMSTQFQQAGRSGRENKKGTCFYLCFDRDIGSLKNSKTKADFQFSTVDISNGEDFMY